MPERRLITCSPGSANERAGASSSRRGWRCLCLLIAAAAACAQPALADIRTTQHNLAKKRPDGGLPDAREVCIFCHTPVIGGQRVAATMPRWQASVEPAYIYTLYDDIGSLGFDRVSVGSQSIACLSCHDANQALAVGRTSADHPFGVPYRGALKHQPPLLPPDNKVSSHGRRAPRIEAKKLVALDDFRDISQGVIDNRTVYWVSRAGMTANRSRGDLPLYARLDESTGSEVPHIECSSCHDPHSPNESFLRVANASGVICLTCHTK